MVYNILYYPVGLQHKLLNNIVWEFRKKKFWVERHSYSFRVMFNNIFIASFHVYPGYNEVVVRLYNNDTHVYIRFINLFFKLFNKYMPNYYVKVIHINSNKIINTE